MNTRITIIACFLLIFGISAQAQWVSTNGPDVANVNSLASISTNVFAEVGGRIFRSMDSGGHWTLVSNALTGNVIDISALAASGNTLFAGIWNDGVNMVSFSTDNGTNWTKIDSGSQQTKIDSGLWTGRGGLCLAAMHTNTTSPILFAGTEGGVSSNGGVWRSTNNGKSWIWLTPYLGLSNVTTLAVIGPNSSTPMLFAGTTSQGVLLSKDNGTTWGQRNVGLPSTSVVSLMVIGPNSSAPMLFAGTDSGVFLWNDSGTTWSAMNNGLTSTNVQAIAVIGTDSSTAMLFAATGDSGVFSSSDNGKSWMAVSNGLANMNVSFLLAVGTNLFAGTNGSGIFISTDSGMSWHLAGSGFPTASTFEDTWFGTIGSHLYTNGNYVLADSTTDWVAVNNGLPQEPVICPFAELDSTIFASTDSGVFLSTDNGLSWNLSDSGMQIVSGLSYIAAFTTMGTNVFAAGGPLVGIYRSTDTGKSWIADTIGLPSDFPDIRSFAVIGSNLFAGDVHYGAFLSTDSGASWVPVNNGSPKGVLSLAVIGTDLFAGTVGGVFLSTDSGNSWTSVSNGLTELHIQSLVVSGKYLFAGTYNGGTYDGGTYDGGVFLSTNNGASWTSENTGLANTYIYDLAVIGTDLYAGIFDYGVWRRPLSDFANSSVSQPPVSPSSKIQVYPNPSLGSTTVSFSSPVSGYAEISITNMLGKEVAQLYLGEIEGGDHSYVWYSTGIPPGLYECLVKMNGKVVAIPIIKE